MLKQSRPSSQAKLKLAFLICLSCLLQLTSVSAEPWFGIQPPPALDIKTPAIISSRPLAPAQFAPNEAKYQELLGSRILEDVATIVSFSEQSRLNQEVGDGAMWGRISGFPSGEATALWAEQQFKSAGLKQVHVQTLQQNNDTSLWLPLRWSMTLQASKEIGENIQLQSAMPLAPSELPSGGITASLISVGNLGSADLSQFNVKGKIAVVRITPQAHLVFERRATLERTKELFNLGAVAVIIVVDLPGNLFARDFNNCGGPCFNLGGRDGYFLLQVLDKARAENKLDQISMKLSLEAKSFKNLSAKNIVATLGSDNSNASAKENIIINAHMDAWFDGAGDNGDGLAVLMALARHFSKSNLALNRDLIFVASAGHHTSGLNGPRALVAQNPELMKNTQVIINIEHVAQRNISPARQLHEDGYRFYTTDANEAPIVAGVSNQAPYLENLINEGISRFGVNFVSAPSTMASGEGGGYRQVGKVIVTTMQAPPLYHTSGESLEMISEPGLEKVAHFYADFITNIANAPSNALNPN